MYPAASTREYESKKGFNNSGDIQLKVPGFGMKVDFELDEQERFRHGANDFRQDPRITAREITMLGVMNALTEKPSWYRKVFDETVVAKWRREALQIPLMSVKAWDWCLMEVQDKARTFEKTIPGVLILDNDSRVWKSDVFVDNVFRQEFKVAVEPLMAVPNEQKDWHPNSNEQVLNLVHPSLYPLVYGRTPVLLDGGHTNLNNLTPYANTSIAPIPERPSDSNQELDIQDRRLEARWSYKFQWLPCEVEFAGVARKDVRITSYINNLHPRHTQLYSLLEQLISKAIEPWNQVLVRGGKGRTPVRTRAIEAKFSPAPKWVDEIWDIEKNKEQNPEAYAEAVARVKEYVVLEDDHEPHPLDYEEIQLEDPEHIKRYGLGSTAWEKYERLKKVRHPEPGVDFIYDQ
jgi:hypothetical protein